MFRDNKIPRVPGMSFDSLYRTKKVSHERVFLISLRFHRTSHAGPKSDMTTSYLSKIALHLYSRQMDVNEEKIHNYKIQGFDGRTYQFKPIMSLTPKSSQILSGPNVPNVMFFF